MISVSSEVHFSLLCLYICKLNPVQLQYLTVHVLASLKQSEKTKAFPRHTAEQDRSRG